MLLTWPPTPVVWATWPLPVCPVTPLPRLQAPVSTLGTSGQPQPISSSPLPSKAGVIVPIFTELETEAQRG